MQRIFKLVSMLTFFLSGMLHAQEPLRDLGEWMAHYYENPTPEQLVERIKDASAAGVFGKQSSRFPMMIFVSEVVKRHPEKGMHWCKELSSLPSTEKTYIGWSFRNANIPGHEACIAHHLGLTKQDIQKIMSATRYDPLSKAPSNPGDLDMLWVVFMATGSEVAVNKIIDVLDRPLPEKGTPGSLEALLLKEAARWSLSSNIHQHRRVEEIAKTRHSQASGSLRHALDGVIQNASKQTNASADATKH